MAYTALHLGAAGQLLVLPARLRLVVPATVGSGSGAMRLVTRVAAGAGKGQVVPSSVSRGGGLVVAAKAGSEGRDDSNSDDYTDAGGFAKLDIIINMLAGEVLSMLDQILPATAKEQFVTKYTDVKTGLEKAVKLAQECSSQEEAALEIMRGWYGIVVLAHACYPHASLPALPGEQAFLDLCRAGDKPVILGQAVAPLIAPYNPVGRGMSDSDVHLIRSLFIAVVVCRAAAWTTRANYD